MPKAYHTPKGDRVAKWVNVGCGDCGRGIGRGEAIQRDADGVVYHAGCDADRDLGFDYTADAARDAVEAVSERATSPQER